MQNIKNSKRYNDSDDVSADSFLFRKFALFTWNFYRLSINNFLLFILFIANDKSSVEEDRLTDPGEYENLPFHGMQNAPNKVSTFSFIIIYIF